MSKTITPLIILPIPKRFPRCLGGHTQIIYTGLPPVAPHMSAGTLRALAVTSAERAPAFADVPTLREAGIPDQECDLIIGVVAPAGTAPEVLSLLQKEIAGIVALPDVKATLDKVSFRAVASPPAAFATQMKTDIAVWGKVMKDAGINDVRVLLGKDHVL